MKKIILGLVLALLPQIALADYILKGPHTTVETDGSQADGSVNLITKNAGPINFYTNNTLRETIDSSGNHSYSGGDYTWFIDGDAQRKFKFDASSDTALTFTFGDGTASQNLQIRGSTADNSDTQTLQIFPAGGSGSDRGSAISMNANEVSGGGDITISTGNIAGSELIFKQNLAGGIISFRDSSNATFASFDSTSGVNGGLNIAAGYGIHMGAYVPTPAATPVLGTNDYKVGLNIVGTATAGHGAFLPFSPAKGDIVEIINSNASNEIQIFPGTSDTINGAVADTVIGLGGTFKATCIANSSSAWFCHVPIAAGVATPGA